MDRNLALELVRVSEASAMAAARWMGKGDSLAADQAATQAMHQALNAIAFKGDIVLGEGDREFFPLLFTGEEVGSGTGSALDIAVDPLECTNSVAFGRTNAMAVVAMTPKGDIFIPPVNYMEKIAVGPEAATVIDLNLSIEENLDRVAEAKGYTASDLTVVMLDRTRHAELIKRVKRFGARIHLIPDGDVAAAVAAATPGTGIDVLMGTGGAVAGVLAAAALRCLGGDIQARLEAVDQDEINQLRRQGFGDLKRVYRAADLVRGDNVMFAATGVTDGDMLNGVRYRPDGATTHSVVMRLPTRTRRYIVTEHYFSDNPKR